MHDSIQDKPETSFWFTLSLNSSVQHETWRNWRLREKKSWNSWTDVLNRKDEQKIDFRSFLKNRTTNFSTWHSKWKCFQRTSCRLRSENVRWADISRNLLLFESRVWLRSKSNAVKHSLSASSDLETVSDLHAFLIQLPEELRLFYKGNYF